MSCFLTSSLPHPVKTAPNLYSFVIYWKPRFQGSPRTIMQAQSGLAYQFHLLSCCGDTSQCPSYKCAINIYLFVWQPMKSIEQIKKDEMAETDMVSLAIIFTSHGFKLFISFSSISSCLKSRMGVVCNIQDTILSIWDFLTALENMSSWSPVNVGEPWRDCPGLNGGMNNQSRQCLWYLWSFNLRGVYLWCLAFYWNNLADYLLPGFGCLL